MNILGSENINESLQTHFLIYKITNLVNGKYYIGQHQTKDPYDNYMGSGLLIIKAINKYGIDNFSKSILFDFDNKNSMNNKEKELVPLSACYPYNPLSYNLAIGGQGGSIIPITKDRIDKQRNTLKKNGLVKGSKNGMFGKGFKLKGANNGCYERKWMYNPITNDYVYPSNDDIKKYLDNGYIFQSKGKGIKKSESSKQKNRIAHLGKKHSKQSREKMRGILIYNPVTLHQKRCKESEFSQYSALGYIRGCLNKPKINSKWMNNGIITKQVLPEDFELYLSNGWQFGRKI